MDFDNIVVIREKITNIFSVCENKGFIYVSSFSKSCFTGNKGGVL